MTPAVAVRLKHTLGLAIAAPLVQATPATYRPPGLARKDTP